MNIKILSLFCILLCMNACAQSTKEIAGQYSLQGGLLVINPNNTFVVIGMGTIIKGNIEIQDTLVKLIPYKPKQPFVLYGRILQTRITGNTIMFQSFSETNSLINYEENNSTFNKMKQVFNPDANCIDYPTVLDNSNINQKIYLAIEDSSEVYEYPINHGYNDFIAIYLPQYENADMRDIYFTMRNGKIYLNGEIQEKIVADTLSKKDLDKIIGMYERAYSESEYYYCNPAYNFFEENGIDLSQYKKEKYGDEYYYLNKYNAEEDDSDSYHNIGKIYEYKKITPTVLKNKRYTIEKSSVFNYNCTNQ